MGGFLTKASDSIGKEALLKFGEEVLHWLDDSLSRPKWTDQALTIIAELEKFVNDPGTVPKSAKRLPEIKDKLRSLRKNLSENLLPRSGPSAAAATTHTPMDWEQFEPDPESGQDAPRALSSGHQPLVASKKEDGNSLATPPGCSPQTQSAALDGQTQQVEASRKEGDKSKDKKKHSAHSPDGDRLAAQENVNKELSQRVRALEQELRGRQGDYQKLRHRNEALETQLSNAQSQIANLMGQVASVRSQFVGKVAALEDRCGELQKQLQAVEAQKGKEAGAYGLYPDSGATPADLRKAAEGIKVSVQGLSGELMRFAKKEWRGDKLQSLRTKQGIKLARLGDLRFWIQREIVGVAFRQLWDSDSFALRSCPLGSDVSESQQHWYARYELVHKDAERIPNLLDLSYVQLAGVQPMAVCYGEACVATKQPCSCGGAEFASFCYKNLKEIQKLDIWRLVPAQDLVRIQQSFITFLTDVWLAYMLALAFEQPACLFKVERGQEFAKATMESAVIQEELDVDEEEHTQQALRRVEFMIIPGFRVGRTVIQSHVYIDASP